MHSMPCSASRLITGQCMPRAWCSKANSRRVRRRLKAPHLQSTSVPVTIRFSDFAGVSAIPDTDPNASPRGLAVKFHLPDGTDTDLVTHSYNGFPTATAAEFRGLLLAIAASGPDAPKPTPLEKFFETHPIAKTFLTSEKPAPVSFGTLPYFGVNTFKLINANGDVTYARYQLQPEGGAQYLTKDQLAAAGLVDAGEIATSHRSCPVARRASHGARDGGRHAHEAARQDRAEELVEQARYRLLLRGPRDRLAKQGRDRQHPDVARILHRLGWQDRVGDDEFLEPRSHHSGDRTAGEHAVGDIGRDQRSSVIEQRLCRVDQRAAGIDDVIDQDAGPSRHVADHVHHLGIARPLAALVDNGEGRIDTLGEPARAHHAAHVRR